MVWNAAGLGSKREHWGRNRSTIPAPAPCGAMSLKSLLDPSKRAAAAAAAALGAPSAAEWLQKLLLLLC